MTESRNEGMTDSRNYGMTDSRMRSRVYARDEGLKPAMRRAGMKGDVYYETNV